MDIYTSLESDHKELDELLGELVSLNVNDDYRMVLIEQISSTLVAHSRAEESVFYNSIRSVSDNSDVMHSFKEHFEAETLLRTLQLKDKTDMDWKDTAVKLKEALEHHVSEEEGKIFSEARKIFTDEEARMMGDAFETLKVKVSKEGFVKTSFDMVVNLMPPRFIEKLRNMKPTDSDPSARA